jgi:fimbrial isopeptide formation D2 family protein/uncharacterized repeat protein (TIGR01451 family)
VVERSYVGTTEPLTGFLNQGDRLSNSVRVDAVVLDSAGVAPPSPVTTTDTSADSATIAVGSASKSVYAVNGVAPVGQAQVTSGDTVTFRLRYELPLTATKNLTITDFLPLPIFDAAPATWTFLDDVGTAPLAPYQVTWGPLATSFRAIFSPDPLSPRQPTMLPSDTGNSITFGFGPLSADPVQITTVDLLFAVKVTDQPFGDGLLFTNVLEATERNTLNDPTTRVGLVQVLVNEPDLKIYKGVVATDRSSGQFPQAAFLPNDVGPAGVTFQAPGLAGSSTVGRAAAFSNTIHSDGLASRPISSNIFNLDAGDRVTFAIVVENTGNGPRGAFDVTIKDRLPNGFLIPTTGAGLNLRVTDGIGTTTLAHTQIGGGLFGTAAGDGIQINDIDTDSVPTTFELGGLARYDTTNGRNIVVITYDLIVDELAEARQVLRNAAEITRYAALEGGTNRAPTEPPSDMKADATATIWRPTITKAVTSTTEPSTGSSQGVDTVMDAAIGETVNYRIVITLQEGTTNRLVLTDFLQRGDFPAGAGPGRLQLVDAQVTHIGSSLQKLDGGAWPSAGTRSDENGDGYLDQVVFNFGNVLNRPDNVQNAEDTITVTVRARVLNVDDNAAGDTLRNTARLGFGTGPTGSDNISASADIEVVEPRLRIDKSAPPAFVLPGEVVTYTLTVTNDRPMLNGLFFAATAHRIVVTDRLLDPYLELIPGSVEGPTGSSVRPTTDGSLEVALAALAPGASVTVKFKALVLATTPAAVTLENTASVSFSSLPGIGNTPDPHARTGSLSDTVRVPVGPSLTKAIIATSNPDTGMGVGDQNLPDLAIGETVTYRLTITLPQGTTQNLVLSDTLPIGLLPQAVRVLPLGSGLSTSPSTITPAINGQMITVNFGTVQNSSAAVVNAADVIQVAVDALVTGTELTNAANLEFTIGTRTGTLTATAPADPIAPQLTIGKTVAGTSGDAGDLFTYTVTVAHALASPMPGYDITVQDRLDPRLIPVSVSSTMGRGEINGQLVTLTNLPRLAQNEQAVLTYTVRFADTVQPGQRIGNTATLAYDSNPGPGGAPGAASASAPELLVVMPIALTKTISATSLPETGSAAFNPALPDLAVGETVTYRLTATLSEGTQRLVITDRLPAGLVPEAAALISVGAGISAGAPMITRDGQSVTFDFGTVVNTGSVLGGDDVVVQVVARLAPVVAAGTLLVNAAVATVDGPDVPNSTQRAEAFAVAEAIAPLLVLAKAADLQVVAVGNTVGYTLTLAHAPGSTGPAYDVVIADPLSSPDLRLLAGSVATSSGSVTLGNAAGDLAIRVAVPVLLPGQVVTVSFRVVAVSAPVPDGVALNVGSFNAVSAPGVLPPGFDRPLSGSADAFVRIGAGGLPPYGLVTEGLFSGYADEFRRLRENAFNAPAIFAGTSQPGAAVMLNLRDADGGPITMMGVVADVGGNWIANPMQSGISTSPDPNGLQLVRGLAGRPEGEDTILPPPPAPRPVPTPTSMPYTLLADQTPAAFDTRGAGTDGARLTFAGSIQPGGLFAGTPDAPGIAATGAVAAALLQDQRGLAAPTSLGWNRFALDFAAAKAAASVAGR